MQKFLRTLMFMALVSVPWISKAESSAKPVAAKPEYNAGVPVAVAAPNFTVTATVHYSHMGSVSGAGEFAAGSNVTLVATENPGFKFVCWVEGSDTIGNELTLTFASLDADHTVKAVFALAQYNVSIASELIGGTVSGLGEYDLGTDVELTAVADEHYTFSGWSDGEADDTRVISHINRDTVLQVLPVFEPKSYYLKIEDYALSDDYAVSEDYYASGVAQFGLTGSIRYGEQATASLSMILDFYEFEGWYVDDVLVSSDYDYEFTVSGDITLKPLFSLKNYTINIATTDGGLGYVQFTDAAYVGTSASVPYGTTVQIKAEVNRPYSRFVQWLIADGTSIGTTPTMDIVVKSDTVLTAEFNFVPYNATVNIIPEEAGTAEWNAQPLFGETVTFTATASPHWVFAAWIDDADDTVSTNTEYEEQIWDNIELTAVFVRDSHVVTVLVDEEAHGTVSVSAEKFEHGEAATISTTNNYGYDFVRWEENGAEFSTENPCTFTVEDDVTLTAVYTESGYSVHVKSTNDVAGVIDVDTTVAYLGTMPLRVDVQHGYVFTKWTNVDSVEVSTEREYGLVIEQDTIIYANFKRDSFDVTVVVDPLQEMMGTVTPGNAKVKYEDEITVTANPNAGYRLKEWSDGTTENPYTFSVTKDSSLTAVFDYQKYKFYDNSEHGKIVDELGREAELTDYEYSRTMTFKAVADEGYHFMKWSTGEMTEEITLTILGDTTLSAQFDIDTFEVKIEVDDDRIENITGAGRYTYDSVAVLSLTPAYGYRFVDWGNGETANPYSFNVKQDSVFRPVIEARSYTITASLGDADERGTVFGTNTKPYLDTVHLTARSNYGYHFLKWMLGDDIVSTDSNLVVTVEKDTLYKAYFEPNMYTVRGVASPAGYGRDTTVTLAYGEEVTLEDGHEYGYHLENWTDAEGNLVTFPRTVERDVEYTANYAKNVYTTTVLSENVSRGTVEGGMDKEYLDELVITATPAYGFDWAYWENEAGERFEDNPLTITVKKYDTYTAHFTNHLYSVSVSSEDAEMGLVALYNDDITREDKAEVSLEIPYLTEVQIEAVPNPGYHFMKWSDDDENQARTDSVKGEMVLSATFAPDTFLITTHVNYDLRGSVIAPERAAYLEEVKIVAKANHGYKFAGWSNGMTEDTINLVIEDDLDITANFDFMTYPVTVTVENGTVNGKEKIDTVYYYGEQPELTVSGNEHYSNFKGWNDGYTLTTRTYTITDTTALSARFDIDTHKVTLTVNDAEMGSIEGLDTNAFPYGTTINFSAVANEHYYFVDWSDGDDNIERTLQVTGDTNIVARFAKYHKVFAASNDTIMGVTNFDSLEVKDGEVVEFTAEAKHGYHFVKWSNDANTETISVTIDKDTTLTAEFYYNQYTVTVNSEFGTVTGDGEQYFGTSDTIRITPDACHRFVRLENEDGLTVYTANSTAEEYVFTVDRDIEFTAVFEAITEEVEETVVACESYEWAVSGLTYTETGVYTIEESKEGGCVQINKLNLTINKSVEVEITEVVCDSYDWNGTTYTATGEYHYTTTSELTGCDSITTLHLTVNMPVTVEETATACDSYDWNGETYDMTDTYSFTTPSVLTGCDSTTILSLTINNAVAVDTVATECESFEWYGTTYTVGGVYTYETKLAETNCDSIVTLTLTINNAVAVDTVATECESFEWYGTTYTESDVYTYQSTLAETGCDSIVTLTLTINNAVNSSETVVACDRYQRNGTEYTASGDYTYSYVDVNGCTAVNTLHLTLGTTTMTNLTESACESYEWELNGETYIESGIYTYQVQSAEGCTQTTNLVLTINTPASTEINVTECDTYTWSANGATYTEGGEYTNNFTDANGCDAVATLNLTLGQSTGSKTEVAVCGSYTWSANGVQYTESGEYVYENTNSENCPNSDTLALTINLPTTDNYTEVVCDEFTWNATGVTYTASGTYENVTTDALGCEHTAILNLTVGHTTSESIVETACESFVWNINGQTYTESTNVTYEQLSNEGCVQTYTLALTVNHGAEVSMVDTACESYIFGGQTYTESGVYTFEGVAANGCDSTATIDLTIYAPINENYEVAVNSAYTWELSGQTYTESGDYQFDIVDANGCAAIATLNLTIDVNLPSYYTISIVSSDEQMGSVSEGATVAEGTVFTATALAEEGYRFVAWTVNGAIVSTENPYIFVVQNDVNLVALFEENPVNIYTVTLVSSNESMGSVSEGATVVEGEPFVAVATAATGYRFVAWMNGSEVVSTDNPYTFTVTEDIILTALFEVEIGIEDAEDVDFNVYSVDSRIIVNGAEGREVYVFDANGRVMSHVSNASESIEMRMETSGVYIVKVGNAPAKRVVVLR